MRSLLPCVCYIYMHVPRVATHLQVRPAGEVRFTSLRAVMRQLQQEVKGPSAELQPQRSGRVGPSQKAPAIILHLVLCCPIPLIYMLPSVKLIVLRQAYAYLSPLQGGSTAVQEDASYRRPRPSRTMEQAPDGSYKVHKTLMLALLCLAAFQSQ